MDVGKQPGAFASLFSSEDNKNGRGGVGLESKMRYRVGTGCCGLEHGEPRPETQVRLEKQVKGSCGSLKTRK